MTEEPYDAIVVGGGLSGLSCAAQLLLGGARPLLICESKEVGYIFRSDWIGNNRCMMQMGTRHVAWAGGGWWYRLVRELNLPIKLYSGFNGLQATVQGTGEMHHLSMCASPANLSDMVMKILPIQDEKIQAEIERVMAAALALPPDELFDMHRVTVQEWLEDLKADDFVKMLMVVLAAALYEFPLPYAQHISVTGMFGLLRAYACGEGDTVAVFPDVREGLCIPIANEIERRGGAVWRGRRVSKVLTEGGRAGCVVMEDGTEVRAPMVALASSSHRIGTLLDERPAEVQETIAYEAQFNGLRAFETFSLLDRPVDKAPLSWQFLIGEDGTAKLLSWSVQGVAPWTVEPGKYLLASECQMTDDQVEEVGGLEGVYSRMADLTEEIHPGYKDAVIDTVNQWHPSWANYCTAGPKLPHQSPSVDGLWYVGEASVPFRGVGTEGAASAGILGARSMLSTKAPLR